MQEEQPNEIRKASRKRSPASRWWMLTINNPPEDWKTCIRSLGSQWGTAQLEQGENGTPHIQAILWFKREIGPNYWKGKPYWTKMVPAKDADKIVNYCSKDDTRIDGPYSFGPDPRRSAGHASLRDKDLIEAAEHLKAGRFKEVAPTVLLRYFGNCQKYMAIHLPSKGADNVRGHWIFGVPRCGKSRFVRSLHSEETLYIKNGNKWWDNYSSQQNVLLEDLDKSLSCLGHLLKVWLDRYAISPEVKGAYTPTSYSDFYITSNYLPFELWDDLDLVEAITMRCKFIYINELGQANPCGDLGVIPKLIIREFGNRRRLNNEKHKQDIQELKDAIAGVERGPFDDYISQFISYDK